MRKLGSVQRSVLESLVRRKFWYDGCGWVWDNRYGTRKVLNSLVKHGHVKIDTITLNNGTLYHGAFVPTKKGVDYGKDGTSTY